MTRTANVLIVDDNAALAENVSDILTTVVQRYELRCSVAGSADEACELSRKETFQLALLDLHLLDGSGLELMEELRRTNPFLQVVFITGDATVQSAIRALEKGAFGYVLKPFEVPQLVELASKAVERALLLAEREALRSELERSEQRLRDVIDQVPAFVVALDEDGKILVWNRQLEAVTGFGAAEVLGHTGAQFQAEDDVTRLPLKAGGHRSVRWKRAKVSPGEGRAPVIYAVGVDVTDELEMQRRARQAERLAAVGTLAAGLAHEVRNPLNSATLQLQLLERRLAKGRPDPAATSSTVNAINSELDRLNRLVTDFLAFAKPQPLQLELVDLCALVRDVVHLTSVEAERAAVTIRTECEEGVGRVPLDSQRMRQVLLNLVRNAVEAVAPIGGTVTLRVHPEQHASSVVIEVEDDGNGFATDAPVFDAFYTTKDQGTGLGLAIVHRIVSEHGGEIRASSEQKRTQFRITLPQPVSAG